MKKLFVIIIPVVLATMLSSFFIQSSSFEEVPYPAGYRNWTHIKTKVNKSGVASHTGFQHIYANEKAVEGYTTGKFPDGAILVFDVLEMMEQTTGDITEGNRKLVDVMVKDSNKYDATGGWGFEEFKGNSKTERAIKMMAVKYCFSCHASTEKTNFVFSKYRE